MYFININPDLLTTLENKLKETQTVLTNDTHNNDDADAIFRLENDIAELRDVVLTIARHVGLNVEVDYPHNHIRYNVTTRDDAMTPVRNKRR